MADTEDGREDENGPRSYSDPDNDGGSESREPSSLGSSAGSVFCTLERDYARIMNEMKSNEALATYETEYTRLFELLYETHRNEDDLMEKCRNLQDQVIDRTSRSYELEKMVESQEETIGRLKYEIVEASKLADAAHTREQNAQEVIENLRLTNTKLNHELEQKNKQLAMDEDATVNKQKDGWLKERERLTNELETLRQRVKSVTVYTDELEEKTTELEQRLNETQENLDMQRNEVSKERRVRERLEKDLLQLEEDLKLKDNQIQTAETSIKTLTTNITKLDSTQREQKTANEKLQKEINKLMVKRMNLQTELDTANKKIEVLTKTLEDTGKEYKLVSQEAKRTQEQNERYKSEKDMALKKFLRVDSARVKVENDLEHMKTGLKNSEIEVRALHRQIDDEKQATAAAIRDKDVLAKVISGLKEKVKRQHHGLTAVELGKRKIEVELEETTQAADEMKNILRRVEAERDRLNQESQELAQKVEESMDELKLKQLEVFDCKKRLAESEAKFRQQQNLFEAVRAERNTCSKSLIEAQDEIQELKSKLKIMSHQVEQLKEDVTSKETSLAKKEFLLGKGEKDKDTLRAELHSLRKHISEFRKEIETGKKEETRLRQCMQTADMDESRLKKDINTVMNERDILGTQLVRRNDELTLQYSRIKILTGTIERGEAQYAQRLEDIRLLKLEVKKLRSEKVLLSKNIANMSDLRHEIFHLEREFTNERLKVMALEEEVQTPLNIHRWRKLEGSDPDTFELLMKHQILQKRALKMSAELISKEKKIKECMQLYTDLRREVAKHPATGVVAALKESQKAFRERGESMKALLAELNMSENQSKDYKYEIARLNDELRTVKEKYYAQKRKEQKSKGEEKLRGPSTSEPILPDIQPFNKKFCGGGYSMAVPASRNCYSLESAQK